MKKHNILSIAVLSLGMAFAGCSDAEYSIRENSVYIADAASTEKTAVISLETAGADVNVTVRLAKALDRQVEVEVATDPSALQKYNEINSTEYLPVPEQYSGLKGSGSRITIPAGEIAAVLKIHIDDFNMQGKRYAVPVALRNVSEGGVEISASQAGFIYLLSKPLITTVPVMKGYSNEAVKIHPNADWNIRTKEWTIESWVRMSGYSRNNQSIFSNWGNGLTEVFIRFGDANSPYDYLQVKTLGGQVQTERGLTAGAWYHWAFVYNGTTFTIYRNGEKNVQFDPPAPQGPGGTVEFQTLNLISTGTYFQNECAMSQIRFWKTARTPTQIKNNMYFEIDPANPDLIGYWPMNEATGNTFADITGNGSDAVADPHIVLRRESNVRFDK
ncbi:MAG: DUF1735 and LamG domain-containing protein [Tannerella sp.]|jgi:hypothetical protein|nr:DUF1735 and LamG domain-containing protein [Tannerella sp.]